jgi:hypothetical protein
MFSNLHALRKCCVKAGITVTKKNKCLLVIISLRLSYCSALKALKRDVSIL